MRYRTAQPTVRADTSVGAERTVPRGVAKAIRFMQDTLARPLCVGEITAAAGTPERTLRRQFQRFTGQSPVAFHRSLRLQAARQALQDDRAENDVTVAAAAHGFSHFGHFTALYRRRYGELPSATLWANRESLMRLPSHTICDRVPIAVLPFTSQGCGQSAFADAITEQAISALCRTRCLNVLSPDHRLPVAHPSRTVAPQRARYAVRGCVQFLRGRVQVAVRLFEVATGRHLWGNAFEAETEDQAALEKRVFEGVAGALPNRLREAEATRAERRPSHDRTAYGLSMGALRDASALTQAMNERALEAADRARSVDPGFALPTALAAWCHAQHAIYYFTSEMGSERDRARRLIALALGIDNQDPLVLAVLGTASTLIGDLDLAELLIGKCLAIDPYCSMAWQRRGWLAVYRGRDTGHADFSRCMMLDSNGPDRFISLIGLSHACFHAGQYDKAADWAARGIAERPSAIWALRIAAQAQAHCGRTAEARRNVALLLRQYPDLTISKFTSAVPLQEELLARCAEGLEAAGLPL